MFRKGDKVKIIHDAMGSCTATVVRMANEGEDFDLWKYYKNRAMENNLKDMCVVTRDDAMRGGASVDGVERAGYYIDIENLELIEQRTAFDDLKEKWVRHVPTG